MKSILKRRPSQHHMRASPKSLLPDDSTVIAWKTTGQETNIVNAKSRINNHIEDTEIPIRLTKDGRKRAVSFPLKIMKILSNKEFNNIIRWLPDGQSGFIVYYPKLLQSQVLPLFFKQNKYSCFKRKLYRWGFKRRENNIGEDDGTTEQQEHVQYSYGAEIFCHDLFQRGRFDLIDDMTTKHHRPFHSSVVDSSQHNNYNNDEAETNTEISEMKKRAAIESIESTSCPQQTTRLHDTSASSSLMLQQSNMHTASICEATPIIAAGNTTAANINLTERHDTGTTAIDTMMIHPHTGSTEQPMIDEAEVKRRLLFDEAQMKADNNNSLLFDEAQMNADYIAQRMQARRMQQLRSMVMDELLLTKRKQRLQQQRNCYNLLPTPFCEQQPNAYTFLKSSRSVLNSSRQQVINSVGGGLIDNGDKNTSLHHVIDGTAAGAAYLPASALVPHINTNIACAPIRHLHGDFVPGVLRQSENDDDDMNGTCL